MKKYRITHFKFNNVKYKGVKYYYTWYCKIMRIINFKYWFCECHYCSPYGLVISADCEKHD
jgi:hypothetical protein